MDELDALRQVRTTLAREENPDRLALRINWRSAPPPRPRRSFRILTVSMMATATLVAGTLAAISLTSDEDRPVRLEKDGGPHAPGNALLVAATNVQKGPTGKYWHTTRITGKVYAVGESATDHYKVEARTRYEGWTDRSGTSCFTHEDLAARPWTVRDKQKWQKAGAPMKVRVPTVEGQGTLFLETGKGERTCRRVSDQRFFGMTPEQVAALPTQPKQLENVLLDLKGDWEAYAPKVTRQPMRALRGEKRVRALSDVAGALLARALVPPEVRAAAFRMLATLPGVKAEGETTDLLGRPGVMISLPVETTIPLGLSTAPRQLGTYRRQWIIDPGNGTLLAMRDLVATPPRGSRKLPPGDDGKPRRLTVGSQPDRFHKPGEVSEYEVYEAAEWTDTAPN
ncbi:CU044_5270 family protein [Streptosporangium sp. NBC_01469]|uniref:CU044_5270 family protein n=1 Tax=Streptosporangium sp. NBC_01469 TaxID=2903898 RepID=UPI002E2D04AF|nr:CU044_5270 family protein [Streptosporangium sp. NBC_01469]